MVGAPLPNGELLRTRAFGMDLDARFAMPGVPETAHAEDGRALSLRLGDLDALRREFAQDAERVAEVRFPDDRLAVSIDEVADRGYLTYAFDFGHAHIAPHGREAVISPLDEPDWIWQRYLTGQVLPLAAVLQGLEVFHACVLGLDGCAIAVVGHSGGGKTTLALELALRGLDFLSDDVLVVEPQGERLRVHPGIGLANVKPKAPELLAAVQDAGLARPIGASERETRLAIRRADDSLPLAVLFVLTRHAAPRPFEIEPQSPVDPRLLLASSFNFSVRTPARLTRQLDVCARIARTAPVFRAVFGADTSPAAVADAILERASGCLPC